MERVQQRLLGLLAALDALREGFDVYPVVDAAGATSPAAHRTGLERIVQAGATDQLVVVHLHARTRLAPFHTVAELVDIVLTTRRLAHA